MRISDWSSDVCSSDLNRNAALRPRPLRLVPREVLPPSAGPTLPPRFCTILIWATSVRACFVETRPRSRTLPGLTRKSSSLTGLGQFFGLPYAAGPENCQFPKELSDNGPRCWQDNLLTNNLNQTPSHTGLYKIGRAHCKERVGT